MRKHKGIWTFVLILAVCLTCVLMSKWASEEPDRVGLGTLLAARVEDENPGGAGYYIKTGTYDEANAQLTVEIGLKDIESVVNGRFILGFDPEKLTVLRSDGNPLGDSFQLTDVVLNNTSVSISRESITDNSVLISQTKGYVAFGWYARSSFINASSEWKPVVTIRFAVKDGLTAGDLADSYFFKNSTEVGEPLSKTKFYVAAYFQCADRIQYGYNASGYNDGTSIWRDLDLTIINPDGTSTQPDPPPPEGHATYRVVSEPSADGGAYVVNVYLKDIAAAKAAFGLWYDPRVLSLPEGGFELLAAAAADATDDSNLWQNEKSETSAYHTFAWKAPDGSGVVNACDGEVQIARYTFRVTGTLPETGNVVTQMDFSETDGGKALADLDKYWRSVTGEDAPGYYQAHGWMKDADGNLDTTAPESQYDIHVTYETKEPTPPESIALVEITDVDTPVSQGTPDSDAVCASTGVANVSEVTWRPVPADGKFAESTAYTASVTVTAADGYVFSKDTEAKINGKSATVTFPEGKETSDTITVSYTFPETDVSVTTVKLTYLPNNGTEGQEVVDAVKDVPTATIAAPTWDGGDFLYWYDANNNQFYRAGETFTPTADVTMKAIWQMNLSSVALQVTVPVKGEAPKTDIPNADQYTVESVSWADASGNAPAGNFAPGTIYTVTVTLKAKALGNLVDGKYDDNGYAFSDPGSATVNGKGSADGVNASVTGNGIGNTLTVTYTFPKTADRVKHTVTYNSNCDDAAVTVPESADVYEGDTYTLSTDIPARAGYTFLGWSERSSATTAADCVDKVTIDTQDITVYAIWTLNQVQWNKPTAGTCTYGTPIDPVISAPTILDSTSDAANGTVSYQEKSHVLSEYGLTLNGDGTISGTPTRVGTIQGLVITVTAKNGSKCDVTYDDIIVDKAPLTIEAKTKLEKDASQMPSLRVSDFIAAATGLKLDDTIASLFSAPVDSLNGDGEFTGNGVTIEFYEQSALPDKAGNYRFRIHVPADDSTSFANYILKEMSEEGVLVVKASSDSLVQLTYLHNDGTGDQTVEKVVKGVPVQAKTLPACAGREFQYWYDAFNGKSYHAGGIFIPTDDITVKAVWQIDLSSVNVNVPASVKGAVPATKDQVTVQDGYTCTELVWKNGTTVHTGNFDANTVYTAEITLKATEPSKNGENYVDNGYSFGNPCDATVNGKGSADGVRATVTGSGIGNTLIVTYAFPATAGSTQHTVIYDKNCSDEVDLPNNGTVNHGAAYTLSTDVPTRAGYTFAGWSRTENGSDIVTKLENVTQDVTVYAIWTLNQVQWIAPPVGSYTYGTEIAPISAPTMAEGSEDASNGTVAYRDKFNSLFEYGLTLNRNGTISGTPTQAGTVTGLVVTVTAKNGSTFDVVYDDIIVNKAPLTIGAKTKLEKTVSQMSSLKVSDFIAAATGLKLDDTIASLFSTPVDKLDDKGSFTGNGVIIEFYEKSAETRSVKMSRAVRDGSGGTAVPGTPLTALPDKEGTYGFRIRVPEEDSTSLANYILKVMSEDGVLVVKAQSQPITPPDGGGGSGVPYDTPKNSDNDHLAYMVGRANGLFDPDSNMTRAEAAAMMDRLSNGFTEKYPYPRALFSDLNTNAWYIQYVNFASNNGIVSGYPDGSFRPDVSITRGEFATMLANYSGIAKTQASSTYTDVYGHWAAGYITALSQRGIISGYPDGTFRPDRTITRAEAVTMMNGAIGRTPDDGLNLQTRGYVNPFLDVDKNAWFYEQVMEATIDHVLRDFHSKGALI